MDITPPLLFRHTHSTNHDGVTFVSTKALSVNKAYEKEIEMQTQAQAEKGTPIPKLITKLARGVKKSGVYGAAKSSYLDHGSSPSLTIRGNSSSSIINKVDQLEEQLRFEKAERLRDKTEYHQKELQIEQFMRETANRQSYLEQMIVPLVQPHVTPLSGPMPVSVGPIPENDNDNCDNASNAD